MAAVKLLLTTSQLLPCSRSLDIHQTVLLCIVHMRHRSYLVLGVGRQIMTTCSPLACGEKMAPATWTHWNSWRANISPDNECMWKMCCRYIYLFFRGGVAQSSRTGITRIKEPFQKAEYYSDKITSSVNWIQIPKRHFYTGNRRVQLVYVSE